MDASTSQCIDVSACGPARAADVLGAYFEAEHARVTRRRVWRSVAVAGLIVWALGVATTTLTRVDLVFGLGLLGCAVVASGAAEWRTRRRLSVLLAARTSDDRGFKGSSTAG